MAPRFEHLNLCVPDIEAEIAFLGAAFPEFRIRGEGRNDAGIRWVHFGTDETYVALTEATTDPEPPPARYGGRPGVNHFGFEVDDVEALRTRLAAAGHEDSTFPNAHPHRKRVYFLDPAGHEWEFVEYLSDDPAKRHDYELPD